MHKSQKQPTIEKGFIMRLFSSCITLLFLFAFQLEALAGTQHRLALVIGNGDYKQSPLKNPVNDATDFASILRKMGFEVIFKTNASIQEFDQLIDQFGRRLEATKGVGLFFYAGHGVQSRGKNYLIPVAADLKRETNLKYKTIDAQRIIDEMAYAKNGLNIVILDACRDNPLTRSFRGGKRGLAKFDNTPSGLLLAYSTAPGQQAADGTGRNSPYTKQLIRSVQKDNLPLEMVFKDVMKNVKKSTRGQQNPWISSSVDGDFYFSKKVVPAIAMVKEINPSYSANTAPKYNNNSSSQSEFELLFWQSIIDNPSNIKYKAYLEQYPNGHFSSIARAELNRNAPEKTVSTPVNRLEKAIKICHNHLSKKRLTSGRQGNAFSCYNKILLKDPDNSEALSGIKKIEATYLAWADSAMSKNQYDKVRSYIEKIRKINPKSDAVLKLTQKIEYQQGAAQEYASSRTFSSDRDSLPVSSDIRTQFHSAIRDKDIILAESLLAQVKKIYPRSKIYLDFEMKYKQLLLQQETAKLYENLILNAFENNDLIKAEHYLKKMETLFQREDEYLELKKQYAEKLEASKLVELVLTANVDDNNVIINGIERGSTPLTVSMPKGDYLIELKKHGYPTQKLKLAFYASGSQHMVLSGGFATGLALENPPLGIKMIAIEPGCFNMGSPSNETERNSDEKSHQVCIKKGFWIGKYEITQKQWLDVMQENPSYFDECGSDCPVEDVEFYEIQQFIKNLNNRTKHRYRLATEAEWEFVAKSGTNTPFNTGLCLSAEDANINGRHKYNKCSASTKKGSQSTVAVGSYPANAWNVHDMHGNVSEWTCSAYSYYYDGAEQRCYTPKDAIIPGSADNIKELAVRGGSWSYKPSYSRSSARDKEYPNANNKRTGFRLVREK